MAGLSIFLLGPYHVLKDDQTSAHFEYDKVRALLAYLAVESERPLRREFLAGLLWPDQPETTAANSLRQAILKLRLAIGDTGSSPSLLNISRESIQLNPQGGFTVDVSEFATLLEATRRHKHRYPQTCPSCADKRTQAILIYRGDFLDQLSLGGCPEFESWIVIKREHLRNIALQALASLTDFHLRQQELDLAQQYAARQIEIDSLQEGAYQQMMTALALDGQRIAALRTYETYQRLLKIELDVRPDEDTEKLYQLIKAGFFKDHHKYMSEARSNLPQPPTPFFGREKELAGISRLLENPEVRLITLVGPGGVGKTSLALKAAITNEKMFTHGVYFIPLAPLGSAEEIYRSIAATLGVNFPGNLDAKTQLFNYLASREILMILDNIEHLLPAGTEVIQELLSAARKAVIMLTTTRRIHSAHEYVFPILGLEYSDSGVEEDGEPVSAVNLFTHRTLQNGSAVKEADMVWIRQICRLLEGNPLAILMAASLTRTLSYSEIANGIEEGIDLLTTLQADIPERQKSMRSLYDYAWQQLTEKEQSQLRKLSLFRGGFQREGAQKVAEASLSDLSSFIDRSFLLKKQSDRYQIHRLLQRYMHEKLAEAGEINLTLDRHMHYYVEFVQQAGAELFQSKQREWLALLDLEEANLRLAFHTARVGGEANAEPALRLVGELGRYWEQRGYWRDGLDRLSLALGTADQNQDIPADIIIKATYWAGILAGYLGQNSTVLELSQRGLALCGPDSNPHNRALMLVLCGGLSRNQGDYPTALKLYQESLELFHKASDPWGVCMALNNLFRIHYRRNEYQEATTLAQQSLALAKQRGDIWNITLALDFLGVIAHDQGKFNQGKVYLNESLEISRSIGARSMIGHAIYWLGRIARSQAHPELAIVLFEESLAYYREIGGKWGQAVSLLGLGSAAYDLEDYPRAEKLLLDSLVVMQEVGDAQLLAYVKIHMGDVAAAMQQFEAAVSRYRESLSAMIEVKDRWLIALAIGGLAAVAAQQGDMDRAAILFGIEAGIRNRIGTPRSPAEYAAYRRSLCLVRDQISPARLHALRSEGVRIAGGAPVEVIDFSLRSTE